MNRRRALVDFEIGVVDAVMIVFRSLEHDGAPFEGVRVARVRQVHATEVFGHDARLHDGGVEQVARQDLEAGLGLHRLPVGPDDVGVLDQGVGDVVAHGAAVGRHGVGMQASGSEELVQDRRQAAGAKYSSPI